MYGNGIYLERWANGISFHNAGKGYINDVNDFSGITIMSAFAKMFIFLLETDKITV